MTNGTIINTTIHRDKVYRNITSRFHGTEQAVNIVIIYMPVIGLPAKYSQWHWRLQLCKFVSASIQVRTPELQKTERIVGLLRYTLVNKSQVVIIHKLQSNTTVKIATAKLPTYNKTSSSVHYKVILIAIDFWIQKSQ